MATMTFIQGRGRRSTRISAVAGAAAVVGSVLYLSKAVAFTLPARVPPSRAISTPAASGAAVGALAPVSSGLSAPSAPGAALIWGLGALACARQWQRRSRTARFASNVEGGGDIEDVVPFELRGFSLSQLFLVVGFALITFSFFDYFVFGVGGSGIGALIFIYAVPVLLLGAALSYAELQPVDVEYKVPEKFWEEKQTPTLAKIFSDVTRHRYGDDAHLDSSLKVLGLTVAKGRLPQMKKILISKTDDEELEFTMLFESKDVPYTIWSDPSKMTSFDRFFGPGVWSEVYKYSAENKVAALKLTTGTRPASAPAPAEPKTLTEDEVKATA